MSVKKDYLRKLDVELNEWDDKINKLEAQVEKGTPEEKVDLIDHIERLKTKQKLARNKHEELENAHESVWEGLKDGIDSIFDDMISYTETIMSKFKDQKLTISHRPSQTTTEVKSKKLNAEGAKEGQKRTLSTDFH